jgi:L-alanine-DL-glutamate epimerase-like enolase superfamily enzyme
VEWWRYRLDRPVGGSGVASVDLVVVELEDQQGCQGMGFSYVLGGSAATAAAAAREQLQHFVLDQPLIPPEALSRRIQASFNRTGRGPAMVGMAAIDLAAWDLHARSLGVSVGMAMGGVPRAVPVYGSGGFHGGQALDSALDTVTRYSQLGLKAVKPRVSGRAQDLAWVESLAASLDTGMGLMLDANEKCSPSEAIRLLSVAQQARALFVEEPFPAHDRAAYARVSRGGMAIATGEHLQGKAEWAPFVQDRLCDVIQPDLAMLGGLSEALRVARAAELFDIEVAPHFLPGVFVHLAAACPNVTWLEDFPLLEPLFAQPLVYAADATLTASEAPGLGLSWADGARDAWRVQEP